jgi:hypothetical protein
VLINAGLGVGFARSSPWLPWVFAPLTLQQLWSHGHDLYAARMAIPPHWDLQSIAVLCTFPLLLGLIWANFTQRRNSATTRKPQDTLEA